MKQIALVLTAILISSCASRALTGAGREGAFVDDALPDGATIYRAVFDELGEESDPDGHERQSFPLIWYTWEEKVPCSAIRGVEYFRGGEAAGEFSLHLVGHIYGGKYFPRPPRSITWAKPSLWVDADYGDNKSNDFEESEAEFLASHCGVEFHVRN